MTDSETRERIVAHAEGKGGPYIMLPLDQLAVIQAILRDNRISHWVDSDAISLDGKPVVIVINLGRGADSLRAQQLLDAGK